MDRNMYFTASKAFAHQLQVNCPEAILPEYFTLKLTDIELIFLSHYKTLHNQNVTWTVLPKDHITWKN